MVEMNSMINEQWKKDIQKAYNIIMEKSSYEIYHNTYTSAMEEVRNQLKKQGLQMTEESEWSEITSGPGRPKIGKTVRHTVEIEKLDGSPILKKKKKYVHIQVYGMEGGKYELNFYTD